MVVHLSSDKYQDVVDSVALHWIIAPEEETCTTVDKAYQFILVIGTTHYPTSLMSPARLAPSDTIRSSMNVCETAGEVKRILIVIAIYFTINIMQVN
jgi:hypothetical protein